MKFPPLTRRDLLKRSSLVGGSALLAGILPGWARSASPGLASPGAVLSGPEIALTVAESHWNIDGRAAHAVTLNGSIPGPLLRLKQGQNVRIAVTNRLSEETSIHWHGVLVPFQFDGVPGVSFPGIAPGQTFTYEFPIRHAGTFWYHSHSGLQEQLGHYGPLIFDPAGTDPVAYDREHVVVLSDYTFRHPHTVYQRLKQQPGYFNDQKQTLVDLLQGRGQNLRERLEWAAMRMDPTDIADVTGSTYTYLVNGHGPDDNWTGLFQPGERVRLRFINAASQTLFNVRIPGLALTVVQADGNDVRPVEVDEFQIAPAETYDVIVRPQQHQAFTLVAEATDRSGMARATLTPHLGMTAAVPSLRERPLATMKDMGMDMSGHAGHSPTSSAATPAAAPGMDHAHMDHSQMGHSQMDHSAHAASAPAADHSGHAAPSSGTGEMDMSMRNPKNAPQVKMGPGVQTISPMPQDRTGDRGQGLEDVAHRVLVYTDLVALEPNPDPRPPSRTKEIHLTGNMERFMWSFDGEKFSEVTKPIPFRLNERVRVVLVNDTMMSHPIHLHGHFFEVVTGNPGRHPRKHTVNVLPGGKVAFDFTADAPGDWAFHCHLFYHMHAGMMRIVSVRPLEGAAS